jgi:urea transport system substrate-binding protein
LWKAWRSAYNNEPFVCIAEDKTGLRMHKTFVFPIVALCVAMALGWSVACHTGRTQAPIKVGVLHSLSGTMTHNESSGVDATLLALEEINQRGGVLGRPVAPVVVDGRSDWPTFAMS